MDYILMTEPQTGMTYETILDLARFAQDRGLAGFSRSDHYSFGDDSPHATDAFATLAGLARETERIDLCVLVSPITFRHPAVLAKMSATIDEMSGGRLRLGVGTGWMELEHERFGMDFFDWKGRFERLEEALAYLHHAFGRKPGTYSGNHYRLTDPDVEPKPTGRLPIIVGGSGEHKTPRLAGTYADEFNFFIRPVEEITVRVERARAAAEAAGRDPDALEFSVMTSAVAGVDEPGFRANLTRFAEADIRGRQPDEVEKAFRERGLPVGTKEEIAPLVAGLESAGISRFYYQCIGPYDDDYLEETLNALGA